MLKNRLTTLLIILCLFVLGFDGNHESKSDILQLQREIKTIEKQEPVKNAAGKFASDITRRNNEIRALIDIKRLPKTIRPNVTILVDGAIEKISRKHHHDDDHSGMLKIYTCRVPPNNFKI